MTSITNINRDLTVAITLPKSGKDGKQVVEEIAPGDTRSIDIPDDEPQVIALRLAGQITTGNDAKGASAAKKETPAS